MLARMTGTRTGAPGRQGRGAPNGQRCQHPPSAATSTGSAGRAGPQQQQPRRAAALALADGRTCTPALCARLLAHPGASLGPAPWPWRRSCCAAHSWCLGSASASWAAAWAWRGWRQRQPVRPALAGGVVVVCAGARFMSLPAEGQRSRDEGPGLALCKVRNAPCTLRPSPRLQAPPRWSSWTGSPWRCSVPC